MARKGMLHTLSYGVGFDADLGNGEVAILDLSAELTRKMQRMVRQGQIFKLVGIDMAMQDKTDNEDGQATGYFQYMLPTKGRCDAWRTAFFAVQKWRKIQGIPANYNYDFRIGFNDVYNDPTGYSLQTRRAPFGTGDDAGQTIPNQAFLEIASNGDGQGLCMISPTANSATSIFDVHNLGIEYNDGATAPSFGYGWTPYFPTSNVQDMDFVINEHALLVTNPKGPQYASLIPDTIPWSVAYADKSTDGAVQTWKWRPVTGEYVPIMLGLLELHVDDVSNADKMSIIINIHLAGWKPILQRKKRRKSRRRKSRK